MYISTTIDEALREDKERRAALASRETLPTRYRAACAACDIAEREAEAAVKALDDALANRRRAVARLSIVQSEMEAALRAVTP